MISLMISQNIQLTFQPNLTAAKIVSVSAFKSQLRAFGRFFVGATHMSTAFEMLSAALENAIANVDEAKALQPQPECAPAQLAIIAAIDSPKKITVESFANMSVS